MLRRNTKKLARLPMGVVALSIAGVLCVAPGTAQGLDLSAIAPQSERAAGEHARQFRSGRAWDACGGQPYEGWQGCLNFDGVEYLSSDGATLLYTEDSCTSPDAASAELKHRLASAGAPGAGYRVLRQWLVGKGLMVELDVPIAAATAGEGEMLPKPGRFMYCWLEESLVRRISGPSEGIILELFARNPDKRW